MKRRYYPIITVVLGLLVVLCFLFISTRKPPSNVSALPNLNSPYSEGLTSYKGSKITWQTSISPEGKIKSNEKVKIGIRYDLNISDPNELGLVVLITNPLGQIARADTKIYQGDWFYLTYPDRFIIGSNPLDSFYFKPNTAEKGEYKVEYFINSSQRGKQITLKKKFIVE